jgi:hypothetical protein
MHIKEFLVIKLNGLCGADSITVEQRQERTSLRDNRRVHRTLKRCNDINLNKLFEYVHRNKIRNFKQIETYNILAQTEHDEFEQIPELDLLKTQGKVDYLSTLAINILSTIYLLRYREDIGMNLSTHIFDYSLQIN